MCVLPVLPERVVDIHTRSPCPFVVFRRAELTPSLHSIPSRLIHSSVPSRLDCEQAATDKNGFESPSQPNIAFFWQTDNDANLQIPSCAGFNIRTTENPNSASTAQPPLYFTAAAVGYEPHTMALSGDVVQSFVWSASYPTGTKLTLTMADSANNSGGSVDGYTIIPGYNNCTLTNDTTIPISFSTYPTSNPCDEMILDVSGGTAPYTVSILAGTSGTYANLTDVKSSRIKLQNVVPAGQSFHLFVTDSRGQTSAVSDDITSGLNSKGCNAAIPSSSGSSTPVGAIVGGVVGGIAAALIIAGLAWWWLKRKRAREAEAYRRQQHEATTEFRMPDGQAPLVKPFMVPIGAAGAAAATMPAEGEDPSPTSGSGSYDKSFTAYSSYRPVGPADPHYHAHPSNAPSTHSAYQRHPSDPTSTSGSYAAPTLYDPYDPHTPAAHGSYESNASGVPMTGSYDPSQGIPPSSRPHPPPLQTSVEPHPSSLVHSQPPSATSPSSARRASSGYGGGGDSAGAPYSASSERADPTDGLANPDEFTYRVFDASSSSQGTWPPQGQQGQQLPPGAGRYP
ncbi:hypothetical protein JCM10207_007448 [Rhodosporidiobolus poonsookiae]